MSQIKALTFVAIRHGESELDKIRQELGENCLRYATETDSDLSIKLTEKGYKQSLELAATLREILGPSAYIKAIVTSPYLRTRETATILEEALKVNRQNTYQDKALAKRNLGQLWNVSWLGLKELYPEEHLRYLALKEVGQECKYTPPDGENYLELFARTSQFCQQLPKINSAISGKEPTQSVRQEEGEDVIIAVTHSSNLAALKYYFEGLTPQEAIDAYNSYSFKNTDLLIYRLNHIV